MRTRMIDASGRRPGRVPRPPSSSGVVAPPALALDALAAVPAGWYNCARRERSAYVGPLVRVQRTSDLAQQDIGYTAGNDLDVAALAAFCVGTTGRVITLYDQSGNGRHLAQPTHANQPIIFSGGAVVILGARPAMDFDGVGTYLERADACGLVGTSAYTVVNVAVVDVFGTTRPFHVGAASIIGSVAVSGYFTSATAMVTHHGNTSCTYGVLPAGTGSAPHYSVRLRVAGVPAGDVTARVNGVPAVETAEANPAIVPTFLNERTILGVANIGGSMVGTFFDGRQTAFGVWISLLSGADIAVVEAACAAMAAVATAFDVVGPALVNEWDAALSPIIMGGGGVQVFGDLRGGNDFAQPVPALQPARVIAGPGGLQSYIVGNGIDQYLSNNAMALSGDVTFICVARLVSAIGATPHNIVNFGDAAGVIRQNNAAGFRAVINDSVGPDVITGGPTDSLLHAFVLRNAVGVSRKFYIDGGAGVAGVRTLGMDPITDVGMFANAVTIAGFGNVEWLWGCAITPSPTLPQLNLIGLWMLFRFGIPWTAAT